MSQSRINRLSRLAALLIPLAWHASAASAATQFDAGGGTQWWFNPTNWSVDQLPPNNLTVGTVTDVQVNLDPNFTGSTGLGVVYDPSPADPGFAAAVGATYPAGYSAQKIAQLYVGRNTSANPLLTIRGDLQADNIQVGRSSGVAGTFTTGRINQVSGTVLVVPGQAFDIGAADTSNPGSGNGIYDYQGGILSVGASGATNAVRMAHGSTNDADGSSGEGRIIVRNPGTPGHVRFGSVAMSSYRGINDMATTAADPNGTTTGVSVFEFHYGNGGTRPIQVAGSLSINNGFHAGFESTTSARLDFRLDSAVTLAAGGAAPINLGLIDVDYSADDFVSGIISGSGTNGGLLSSADGSALLTEGAMVSAIFGTTKYNWQISYTGEITWSNLDASVVASVTPGTAGTNRDLVLLGHSIETVVVPNNADFNGDLKVDGADFVIWQRNLGVGTLQTQGDANGDGAVNAADLGVWRTKFGQPVALGAAGAVPEPASAALAALACVAAATLRRRD
ncbi:MAG TPA: dockerin type I domain-containing protein [Lacipirellulaceae bacterium]|nr:dockerin type I domain-containing protein [Lacipirellulaceae bacterium]